MSDDDEDLKINTVERFAKHSTRLVLEQHSHCEVPAGCGGVVLQWRNPAVGLPVTFDLVGTDGTAEVYIDGVQVHGRHVVLEFGDHLLAVRIRNQSDKRLFIWATQNATTLNPDPDQQFIPELSSAADGSWLSATQAPEGNWLSAEYDDSQWSALTAVPLNIDDVEERARWRYQRILNLGTVPLQLPEASDVFIRKRIHVDPSMEVRAEE